MRSALAGLLAQDARLRAEHARAAEIEFPSELTDAARTEPRAAEAMAAVNSRLVAGSGAVALTGPRRASFSQAKRKSLARSST